MNRIRWIALLALAGVSFRVLAHDPRSTRPRRRAATAMPDRARADEPEAHHEALDTYQALLDESLQLTFPASDPVCAHAATRCAQPCETPSNPSDWRLQPGSASLASAVPRR